MTTILIIIIVLLVLWAIYLYNHIVRMVNRAKEAWADIDVQLKRRYDLIPNLVETVKGYAKHEREVFENVTQARAAAQGVVTAGPAARAQAEGGLSQALGRLFAVAEAYPDLKANQNFLALQEELASTENRIAFARQAYNDQVLFYNNKIQMFPSNVVAGMFNFAKRDFFEIEDAAEKSVPKVSF